MASTYSDLKIQLMAVGENTTTWGNVANLNLGTAIEEAIAESTDVTFASAEFTVALTDTNASQPARHLRLNLGGTSGGAQNLVVPTIEKPYIINNGTADIITVKTTAGTGIAVPSGKTMWVYADGTNVVDVVDHLTTLTLGTALPVASGGTGATASTGTGDVVLATSPTLVTPLLGTPTSGNLANCTNVVAAIGAITGLGTNVGTFLATPSSANLLNSITDETGTGLAVFATSPTLVTPLLGTPTSGNLTNCTGTLDNTTAATATTKGAVELATAAEINTGTDTARVLNVDAFAASNFGTRVIGIPVVAPDTDCSTGNGKAFFYVTAALAGMNIISAGAAVYTAGTTGTMDIQLRNVTQAADILSTKITIDSTEVSSDTGATPVVIDGAQDDLTLYDRIAVDIDAVQTTAAKGLVVFLECRLP